MTRNRFLGTGALIGLICGGIWGCFAGVSLGVVWPNILLSGSIGLVLGILGAWVGFAVKTRKK